MAISKLPLTKVVRESLIDAVNKVNEIIDALNPWTGTDTTTTVADIIQPASGVTITSATYAVCGKVAMVRVTYNTEEAKTGTWNIGQLVSGKRPAILTYGSFTGTWPTYMQLQANGTITVNGSKTAGSAYACAFTYLLA